MSSRILRPNPESGITKRGRKARQISTDDDQQVQRERKRAMDRKAQRVSREKTRSHIAHLEKMMEILCEKNESTATKELMAEVNRLNLEIDRLRKIIESIKSVLCMDSPEPESSPRSGPLGRVAERNVESSSRRSSMNEIVFQSRSPTDFFLESVPQLSSSNHASPEIDDLEDVKDSSILGASSPRTALDTAIEETVQVIETPAEAPDTPKEFPNANQSWNQEFSLVQQKDPNAVSDYLWHRLFPTLSAPHVPRNQRAPVCDLWQRSNRIYAKIFNIRKSCSSSADELSTSTLVKAVKDGWSSLSIKDQNNPALQVLREVDVEIFGHSDKVTKIAMLHKSHRLMKYFLNSNTKNWNNLAAWQRPVRSQSTKQHPITIDFFAWPGFRDRLVEQHKRYYLTPDFTEMYRYNFIFSWPFSFDDTYSYNADTGTYFLTPVFEHYHNDLKYWGMKPEFFEKYPEMSNEIPLALDWNENPNELPKSDASSTASETLASDSSTVDGTLAFGFEGELKQPDVYMMELFNECPQIV